MLMLFNRITAFAICIAMSSIAICQNKNSKIKFGDITPEDFKPAYYDIDSSADAVILYDVGSARYEGNNQGWFSVVFHVHERKRLLHKLSFDDLATVKIPVYVQHNYQNRLEDLQAATYNLEDGKVTVTKIEKNGYFKDRDGNYEITKFTFPSLKEGSIIEYTYTITSPLPYSNEYLPDWSFQAGYPTLWSSYTIESPQFFDFVVLKHGYLEAVTDTATLTSASFNVLAPGGIDASKVYNIKSNSVKHTWSYKNIPAIKEESFTTNISNYSQRVEFQLYAHRFPEVDAKFFMHTWPEMAQQLMEDESFGADLSKGNGWLKDDVQNAAGIETEPLKKAKKIYEFVRDNYTCIDYSAIYLSQTLKKTQQSKKGNVVDINMLLIAMLRNAGYSSDPVLLSTREHGKANDVYPMLRKFNYLIANVSINNKQYQLDAADPILGFGHLGADCYNGNARLVASLPSLIDLSADSLHESEITTLFISNGEEGNLTGHYKHVMGQMQSNSMREKMKKTNAEEYFKNVKKSYQFDVELTKNGIDSLKQPEMPVSVNYEFNFKPEDDIIYFTPVLADAAYKENPFSAAERFYPVEMPYCADDTYILNMEIPKGYKADELPKSARVSLNDNEGMFEYLIQQSGDNIQLRCRTKLNKATFEPEDYETLRNFFAFIVQKQSEQIVFKKK